MSATQTRAQPVNTDEALAAVSTQYANLVEGREAQAKVHRAVKTAREGLRTELAKLEGHSPKDPVQRAVLAAAREAASFGLTNDKR